MLNVFNPCLVNEVQCGRLPRLAVLAPFHSQFIIFSSGKTSLNKLMGPRRLQENQMLAAQCFRPFLHNNSPAFEAQSIHEACRSQKQYFYCTIKWVYILRRALVCQGRVTEQVLKNATLLKYSWSYTLQAQRFFSKPHIRNAQTQRFWCKIHIVHSSIHNLRPKTSVPRPQINHGPRSSKYCGARTGEWSILRYGW